MPDIVIKSENLFWEDKNGGVTSKSFRPVLTKNENINDVVKIDGRFILSQDTGRMYYDNNGQRIECGNAGLEYVKLVGSAEEAIEDGIIYVIPVASEGIETITPNNSIDAGVIGESVADPTPYTTSVFEMRYNNNILGKKSLTINNSLYTEKSNFNINYIKGNVDNIVLQNVNGSIAFGLKDGTIKTVAGYETNYIPEGSGTDKIFASKSSNGEYLIITLNTEPSSSIVDKIISIDGGDNYPYCAIVTSQTSNQLILELRHGLKAADFANVLIEKAAEENLYIVCDGYSTQFTSEDGSGLLGSAQVAIGIAVHAIGKASVAFGRQNYTSGGYSFAAGRGNNVAQYGVAFGKNNKVYNTGGAAFGIGNQVDGAYGIATGNVTTASGHCSFAGGQKTIASGDSAFAYGQKATASGSCSLAFGAAPTANGEHSVAIGFGNKANGNYSIALGKGSITDSDVSFIFGGSASNVASLNENDEIIEISESTYSSIGKNSSGSIVLGVGSRVNAQGSIAIGKGHYIKAGANYSIALGNDNAIQSPHTYLFGSHLLGPNAGTTGSGENEKPKNCYSVILGKYNSIGDTENYPIFAVGNGTSTARNNAFEVFNDGNARFNGNIYLTGGDNGRLILNEKFIEGEPTCFIRGATDDQGGININNEIVIGHGTSTVNEELKGIPILYPKTDDFGRLGYGAHPWKSIHVKEISMLENLNGLDLSRFYMNTFYLSDTDKTISFEIGGSQRAFFLVGVATNVGRQPALFMVNVNMYNGSNVVCIYEVSSSVEQAGNGVAPMSLVGNFNTSSKTLTLTLKDEGTSTYSNYSNVFVIGSWK